MAIGNYNFAQPQQQTIGGGMTAGVQVGQPNYGGGPSPQSGVGVGSMAQTNPLATQMSYRPDAGQYLNDADYTKWRQQQPLNALKGETDIQTGAQSQLMSQQGSIAQQQAKLEEQLQEQGATQKEGLGEKAFQFKFNTVSPWITGALGGLQSAFGSPGSAPGGIAPVQEDVAGETASEQAALARAKDVAGSTGRAALSALADQNAARGVAGGITLPGVGNVINESATQIGDVNRENLIQAVQAARQRASENYQGQIAQRGQDVALQGQRYGALNGLISALGSISF